MVYINEVVQELLNHRTRIASITEGIFQDSVKRADLVDMHRFMIKHRDQLKNGLDTFHEKIKYECSIKQVYTNIFFRPLTFIMLVI